MFDFPSIQSVIEYFNSIQPIYIYLIVCGLMLVESSCFIPFPSEVVIPPAAMIASVPGSSISIIIVVIAGTIGAMLGAYINYYIGARLGRPLIHKFADTRFAHAVFINRQKIDKAEAYFVKNGNSSTFIGRLIPGIRQLISLPAGIAKMDIFAFSIYTFLGAGIWNIVLAVVGYICGQNIELFESIFREIIIVLIILAVLFIAYLVYRGLRKPKTKDCES